jgi:hypothetical protein
MWSLVAFTLCRNLQEIMIFCWAEQDTYEEFFVLFLYQHFNYVYTFLIQSSVSHMAPVIHHLISIPTHSSMKVFLLLYNKNICIYNISPSSFSSEYWMSYLNLCLPLCIFWDLNEIPFSL